MISLSPGNIVNEVLDGSGPAIVVSKICRLIDQTKISQIACQLAPGGNALASHTVVEVVDEMAVDGPSVTGGQAPWMVPDLR